jgi:EAL domain-containing protein (putative c-di-GMP-specific phosphodiesterase class I)
MEVISKRIEHKVPEILETIEQDLDYYSAVHIKLSKLQKQNQSLYHAKMAANIIHELMASYQGWMLLFPDFDLVCVFRNINSSEILKSLVGRIRELFVSDPLSYFSNGVTNPDFATIYEFPFNYKHFKGTLETKSVKPASQNNLKTGTLVKNISSSDIADIERNIFNIDLNNVIRKQAVCGLLNNRTSLKPIYNEIYVSIPRLSRILSFDFVEGTNKFLIKYLDEIIENKLLDHLTQDSSILLGGPFSINISVNTILSEAFSAFDSMMKEKIDNPIILELKVEDLLCDMRSAIQAINTVRGLGYKICIKGLNESNLRVLDRNIFKADFGKINWGEDIFINNRSISDYLIEGIKNFGTNRVIINNCNSPEIIDLGKQIGIHLFQGWECDQILKNKNVEILEYI